eukprot:1191584-Amphidinium_carterae.1
MLGAVGWSTLVEVNGNASGVLSMIGTVKYHDWRAAAGKAAQAILEENPDKLIVVRRSAPRTCQKRQSKMGKPG